MDIAGIVAWFTTNWAELIKIVLQIIGTASVIVKLTPTLKDDDVLKGILRFLGKYIALNTNKGTTPS
jgi:hypothetical protein